VALAVRSLFQTTAVAVLATKTALLPAGSRGGVDGSMLHREFMAAEWREQVSERYILGVEKGRSRLQLETEVRRWILKHHPPTADNTKQPQQQHQHQHHGPGAVPLPFRILPSGVAFGPR
jgi:hypothetical protein